MKHPHSQLRQEQAAACALILGLSGLLILSTVVYYLVFASNCGAVEICHEVFFKYANHHDHWAYVRYIEMLRRGESAIGGHNNWGIACLYFYLLRLIPFDVLFVSYIVNVLAISASLVYAAKVLRVLDLSKAYFLVVVLNPAFLYFSLLINKDALSFMAANAFLYYSLIAAPKRLVLAATLSSVVRLQLPLFAATIYFLIRFRHLSLTGRICVVYVASAAASVTLEHVYSIIAYHSMSSAVGLGVSEFVRTLNRELFIGSLMLNPVRVAQYIFDFARGLYAWKVDYFIDVSKLKDLPQIIFLLVSLLGVFLFTVNPKTRTSGSRCLFLYAIAFFAVWLINPTINSRYLLIIAPWISIAGISVLVSSLKIAQKEVMS